LALRGGGRRSSTQFLGGGGCAAPGARFGNRSHHAVRAELPMRLVHLRRMAMRALVVTLLFAGCTQSSPAPPAGTPLELRLRGDDTSGFRAVLLEVRELQVDAGGQALVVEPGQIHLDLTDSEHAWLLGTVRVPDGVDRVEVRLRLDDFGGFETNDAGGG